MILSSLDRWGHEYLQRQCELAIKIIQIQSFQIVLFFQKFHSLKFTLEKIENKENFFIIKAPKGSTLEVPLQNEENDQEYPNQLFFSTKTGEIEFYILSDGKFKMEYEKN